MYGPYNIYIHIHILEHLNWEISLRTNDINQSKKRLKLYRLCFYISDQVPFCPKLLGLHSLSITNITLITNQILAHKHSVNFVLRVVYTKMQFKILSKIYFFDRLLDLSIICELIYG